MARVAQALASSSHALRCIPSLSKFAAAPTSATSPAPPHGPAPLSHGAESFCLGPVHGWIEKMVEGQATTRQEQLDDVFAAVPGGLYPLQQHLHHFAVTSRCQLSQGLCGQLPGEVWQEQLPAQHCVLSLTFASSSRSEVQAALMDLASPGAVTWPRPIADTFDRQLSACGNDSIASRLAKHNVAQALTSQKHRRSDLRAWMLLACSPPGRARWRQGFCDLRIYIIKRACSNRTGLHQQPSSSL